MYNVKNLGEVDVMRLKEKYNISKHNKVILIIVLIISTSITYYISNVNTLMNTIYNLANDNDMTITKIDITAFNGIDRYNYSIVEEKGIKEFINELNEIKILKNNFANLFKNKFYSNLHFESYLISLY